MSVRDLMAGRGGFLCQRLPLWLPLVTSLLIYSSLCSTVDDIPELPPCCKQTTSSHDMICECYPEDRVNPVTSISIHKGSIPTSVQSIKIAGPINVTFHKHAFYDLLQLGTLEVNLNNRGNLSVAEEGLALKRGNILRSLIIENAKDVVFASSGMAGFWNDDARIQVRQLVQSLDIQPNGISFISSRPGPTLIIENVPHLNMKSYALNATLFDLVMTGVHMSTCLDQSFGGDIYQIRMENVQINQIDGGCIIASNMYKLVIDSSDINIVKLQGFSGSIRVVKIKNTNVTKIQPNGVGLEVQTLSIEYCRFDDLSANGLNVTATNSIDLQHVIIKSLKQYALASLNSLQGTININDVSISQAQQGSLAFSERSKLHFLNDCMNIDVPDLQMCPPEKWIRWLVGKRDDDLFTDTDSKLLSAVHRSWYCPGDIKTGSASPDTDPVTMATTEAATTTESSEEATTVDVDQKMGSSSTPAAENTILPKVTPNGEVPVTATTPSREPTSTATPWIAIICGIFVFVMAVALCCWKYKAARTGSYNVIPGDGYGCLRWLQKFMGRDSRKQHRDNASQTTDANTDGEEQTSRL